MGPLGTGRLKPLIPYGGACRLIDFSLANAHRSGLGEVLLLSQFEERQLMDDLHQVWNARPGLRVHFGPYDSAYRDAPAGLFERDRYDPKMFITRQHRILTSGAARNQKIDTAFDLPADWPDQSAL